jgi:hypothetical protein
MAPQRVSRLTTPASLPAAMPRNLPAGGLSCFRLPIAGNFNRLRGIPQPCRRQRGIAAPVFRR